MKDYLGSDIPLVTSTVQLPGTKSPALKDVATSLPSESFLKDISFLSPAEELLSIRRVFDSGRSGESWVYGFETVATSQGMIRRKYLKEKNILSLGGSMEEKANTHVRRLNHLKSIGIPIQHIYGVRRATIYQDFSINDSSKTVYQNLRGAETLSLEQQNNLRQLVDIALILDNQGYHPLNFLADLIFDIDQSCFLYIDGGSDLGNCGKENKSTSLGQLLKNFRSHGNLINEMYRSSTVAAV